MSDKQKAIQILEELPDNISMKDILEALNTIFEINNRIDNFNIDEALTSKELLKEVKRW